MSYLEKLKEGNSLELYQGEKLVFTSFGKWLHPLFEVESFLKESRLDPATLSLHDHVDGKAAAMLTVYLGINKVHSDLLSQGALEIFQRYCVVITYETLVPKIQCMTESIISEEMTPSVAYKVLYDRALKKR